MTATAKREIPDHVPADLVRDVNVFALPGCREDVHLAWKRLQDESDAAFVYSPYNGGHWVTTRAESVWALYNDDEHFSAKQISVPPTAPDYAFPPNASDEPEHWYYKALVNKHVSPRAVANLTEEIRRLATELIEGFRPNGECEFVSDFARHLPMQIFLGLVDLPREDRLYLVELAETSVRSPDPGERERVHKEMRDYLSKWVEIRRKEPGNDLLSSIVHGRVGDRPMTEYEILGEASDVMFGGLDTVTNMMGFIAKTLANNPEIRRKLIDDPDILPTAVEEFLRRHAVAASCRMVIKDCTIEGVDLKADDMVMIASMMHGLDERRWEDPLSINFKRDLRQIATFGNATHRCPGSYLARSEIKIFLEEWLSRIPDFQIKPGEESIGQTGSVSGLLKLPLVWRVA